MAGLAARLFFEVNAADFHKAVHGFQHIVDRKKPHFHRRERFHLNARLPLGFADGGADDFTCFGAKLKVNRDVRKRNRMAQGDEFRGLFTCHDRGNPRHADHVTFFCSTGSNERKGLGLHADFSHGARKALCFGLCTHIHHMRVARGIKMRQFCHFCNHTKRVRTNLLPA